MEGRNKEEDFIAAMEGYDSYVECQRKLHSAMRRGFANIASARFAQPRGITALQYDMNMEARVGVDVEEDGMVKERRVELDSRKEEEKEKEKEGHVDGGDSEEEEEQRRRKDVLPPLQWFGYLPSKDLKDAQKEFVDALQIVIELANKATKVRRSCSAYLNSEQ